MNNSSQERIGTLEAKIASRYLPTFGSSKLKHTAHWLFGGEVVQRSVGDGIPTDVLMLKSCSKTDRV
jgi:hypothetical protein